MFVTTEKEWNLNLKGFRHSQHAFYFIKRVIYGEGLFYPLSSYRETATNTLALPVVPETEQSAFTREVRNKRGT